MAIAFNCNGCGKHYEVSDNLAGKRGKCKQCGQQMLIPSAPAASPALDDIYGLDEGPSVASAVTLTPLPRRGGAVTEPEAPVKKKKKKGGFFGGSKSKSKDGKSGAQAAGMGVGGVLCVILLICLKVGLRTGFDGWGLMSKSEMEGHLRQDVNSIRQMTKILTKAQDGPSAESAVNELIPVFRKMIEHDQSIKDKKARQKDIDEVTPRFLGEMQSAALEWRNEMFRVATIPGAQAAVQRLATSLQETAKEFPTTGGNPFMSGVASGPNFTPPPMTPPPQMTPPQMSPPQMSPPQMNPSQMNPPSSSPPPPNFSPPPPNQPGASGSPPPGSNPNPNPGPPFGPRRRRMR